MRRLWCRLTSHDYRQVDYHWKVLVCFKCDKILDYGDY